MRQTHPQCRCGLLGLVFGSLCLSSSSGVFHPPFIVVLLLFIRGTQQRNDRTTGKRKTTVPALGSAGFSSSYVLFLVSYARGFFPVIYFLPCAFGHLGTFGKYLILTRHLVHFVN